jgi:hypothetical protein
MSPIAPQPVKPDSARNSDAPSSATTESHKGDLLEKAKMDPIVRSFLDVFPGPVTAEKIEK